MRKMAFVVALLIVLSVLTMFKENNEYIDDNKTLYTYSWGSDINGLVNSQCFLYKCSPLMGVHLVFLKVKDDGDTWSESITVSLEINEKETKMANERTFPILLGEFSLLFISILVWILAKKRRKKRGKDYTMVICPGCGSILTVVLSFKSNKIECPICGNFGQVNI